MKKISFLAVILLLSVSAFAILPPGNIQAAFKKMYPKANGIAWSQDDGYYCANFACFSPMPGRMSVRASPIY